MDLNVGHLKAILQLNIKNFSDGLLKATKQSNKFAKEIQKSVSDSLSTVAKQVNKVAKDVQKSFYKAFEKPAKKAKFEYKDVARIVQGIIISKIFYSSLDSIRQATNAVWEFTQQLEYAQIVYSTLFSDTELAAEFINVLKDFAAKTPFTFGDAEAASKRLLAYGIQYENLMYVMQGVLASASMQNDPTKIEQISRALGQIYTKGRLMNEELRQLAEAGIPVYEILREKLALTNEEIANIGRTRIPASEAINAIVDGINERLGAVAVATSNTISGLITNLKDNLTMLFAGLFEPFIMGLKPALIALNKFVFTLRDIEELKGAGGVLEALFPPGIQTTIRTFVANLKNLWEVVKSLLSSAFEVLKYAVWGAMRAFNAIAPIVNMVANILAGLVGIITHNAAVMTILTSVLYAAATAAAIFAIRAAGLAILKVITGLVIKLSKALMLLSIVIRTNPIITLFALLASALVAVSISSSAANSAISSFFKTLTSFNGVDPDKVLLPSQEERANDLEKFNERLDDSKDAMDELADSTGAATKAAKGLLSFDEVFKLMNTPDEVGAPLDETETDILPVPDIGIPELDDGLLDPMDLMPDFSEFGKLFGEGLLNSISDNVKNAFTGATVGGLLGYILGGPMGAKIGAVAGSLAGYFWDTFATQLGLTDIQKISMPIAIALAAAIAGARFGPAGAIIAGAMAVLVAWLVGEFIKGFTTGEWNYTGIGAAIGALLLGALGYVIGGPVGALLLGGAGAIAGYVIGAIVEGFKTGEWDVAGISSGIGTLILGALGFVIAGPTGALIGAAVGALVGWFFSLTLEEFKKGNFDFASLGTAITGTILGGAIGFVVGGPVGGALGAGIGTLVGWLAGQITEAIQTGDWSGTAAGLGIGLGAGIGAIVGGPVGALIGAAIGGQVGWIVGLIKDNWQKVKDFFIEATEVFVDSIKMVGGAIGDFFSAIGGFIIAGFTGGFEEAFEDVWKAIKGFFKSFIDFFKDIFGINSPATTMKPLGENVILGFIEGLIGAIGDLLSTIADIGSEVIAAIGQWFVDMGDDIATWASDTASDIADWASDTASDIADWASKAASNIADWASDTSDTVTDWISDTTHDIGSWATDNFNRIYQWSADTLNNMVTWASDTFNNFVEWGANTTNNFVTWINTSIANLTEWGATTLSNFTTWISETITKFSEWGATTTTNFTNWINTNLASFTNFVTTTASKFATFVSDSISKFSDFSSKTLSTISSWSSSVLSNVSGAMSGFKEQVRSGMSAALDSIRNFCSSAMSQIRSWASDFGGWVSDTISDAASSIDGFVDKAHGAIDSAIDSAKGVAAAAASAASNVFNEVKSWFPGHATGGVFNREHVARFAEGNKAEAVIPLEDAGAMQPFADAVSNGISQNLAPIFAAINNNAMSGGNAAVTPQAEQLQPLYVGTLIADDRSLRELQRKMQVIQLQEVKRRGF